MQVVRLLTKQLGLVLVATLAITPLASAKTTKTTHKKSSHATTVKKASNSSKGSSAHSSKSHKGKKTAKKSWKSKGQQAMSPDRTREIQAALIREHYLDGEANGVWDSRTQEACRRYQGANGWQTKVLPDSRAIIKLGLGPDHSQVLNPQTAAVSPFEPGGGVKTTSADVQPGTSAIRQ